MKFITITQHAILDYLTAIMLIVLPFALGWNRIAPEAGIFFVMAMSTLAYSLLTNYKLSFFRVFPFSFHLILDFASGVLLTVSPWLFHFSDRTFAVHVGIGIFEIAVVLLTKTRGVSETSGFEPRDATLPRDRFRE